MRLLKLNSVIMFLLQLKIVYGFDEFFRAIITEAVAGDIQYPLSKSKIPIENIVRYYIHQGLEGNLNREPCINEVIGQIWSEKNKPVTIIRDFVYDLIFWTMVCVGFGLLLVVGDYSANGYGFFNIMSICLGCNIVGALYFAYKAAPDEYY